MDKVCVSDPIVLPIVLFVKPEPWPKTPNTRPLQSGKLKVVEPSPEPNDVPIASNN